MCKITSILVFIYTLIRNNINSKSYFSGKHPLSMSVISFLNHPVKNIAVIGLILQKPIS